ncbi:MAG TPA: tryptophan synthase subunit alpha [Terriglobales bacterium]|nr:tryptophan synthase subunit alpha [Terriglobales bacterium]
MPLRFDKKPALVAYVTCGDPAMEVTRDIVLAAIDAGADVVELGVPFSDPVADGPVIQRASERALRAGATLKKILAMAREVRALKPKAGLLIFSYLNPVLRMRLERFCAAAADAGIDGALLTDMTVEEAGDYLECMRRRKLATVFLAAPTSSDARLEKIAAASSGFVYAVSRTGVTGARQEVSSEAQQLVARVRKYSKLPVAVGFGISTPEQFAAVGAWADGVVVGSAIVERIEANRGREPEAVANFIGSLKRHAAASARSWMG